MAKIIFKGEESSENKVTYVKWLEEIKQLKAEKSKLQTHRKLLILGLIFSNIAIISYFLL